MTRDDRHLVEFLFDYRSPYSYLAEQLCDRLHAVLARACSGATA